MNPLHRHLARIEAQHDRLVRLLVEWAEINSGTGNLLGLERSAAVIQREFAPLADEMWTVDLPPRTALSLAGEPIEERFGRAIRLTKRPGVRPRSMLCIHYDTVYGPGDPFQRTERIDAHTLQGPGVADAKGGVLVMLAALEALEAAVAAGDVPAIGWDVVLNPDEELGSPGSAALLAEVARGCDFGLLFEPALPDGSLVAARKGSGQFTAIMTGRSAHAGRDPHLGRNAVAALAEFVVELAKLNDLAAGIVVNVGRFEGGGAANVVPALAACRFNVRVVSADQQRAIEAKFVALVAQMNTRDGLSLRLDGGFFAPPKQVDPAMLRLLKHARACGRTIGLDLAWRDTGGACDGNRLAAAGLPNVDSLGVRGGNLHSPQEYVLLDSITERAKLAAAMLMTEMPQAEATG